MANLLSPEKSQDPLDLVEELTEELNLTPSQVMQRVSMVLRIRMEGHFCDIVLS